MKKLVLISVLAIMLALMIGQAAFADSCCEEKICQMAIEHEKVTEAQCVIYERCCLVAIRTEKYASKSEYDEFVKELTERIQAECEVDHVFVTRNPKVMAKINALADKTQAEKEEAIKQLLDKEIFRHRPGDKLVFPKRTGAEQ